MAVYRVYLISNNYNSKVYVGSTKQDYLCRSGLDGEGYKGCPKLWKAIKSLGWPNFSYETLEETESAEEAKMLEEFYIDLFDSVNNGYNVLSRSGVSTNKSKTKSKHDREMRKAKREEKKKRKRREGYRLLTRAV